MCVYVRAYDVRVMCVLLVLMYVCVAIFSKAHNRHGCL